MSNYSNGASKERRIVNKAIEEGKVSFRSAGSHSPIDLVIIDHEKREIKLIQSKMSKNASAKAHKRLLEQNSYLNGYYHVVFGVVGRGEI